MLTKEEVKHIADLARIELSEKETEKYQAQLGKILDYMEKLKQVNTIGTPISDGGMIDLENVWREDEISDWQLVSSPIIIIVIVARKILTIFLRSKLIW